MTKNWKVVGPLIGGALLGISIVCGQVRLPGPGGSPGTSTPTVATPVDSPGPGSYSGAQTITITTATSGATICYTVDGSTPAAATAGTCSHGTTYATSFTSPASSFTLKSLGTKAADLNSAVRSSVYTIGAPPTAATPVDSPGTGTYSGAQTISITSSTSGATICYTVNGTVPTAPTAGTCTVGMTYGGPFTSPTATFTLNAIATKAAFTNSALDTSTYTITGTVATPVDSPGTGTYAGAQTVSITTVTPGATICYTTDGSTPAGSAGSCSHGTTYSAAFTSPSSTFTLESLGTKSGSTNSAVKTSTYTIAPTVATPVDSPGAGTYTAVQTITITTSTSGAAICYTTDGSTPAAATAGTCSHGTTYSGAFSSPSSTFTLKAIGTKAGSFNSAVDSSTYTINLTVVTPVDSPGAGSYTTAQSVTITTSTSGASICYTTDGSTPAAATAGTCSHGTTYAGAFTSPSSTFTLQAIGTKSGFINSSIDTSTYTITPTVLNPVDSPGAGTYTSAQTITITTSTSGATICYTVDGSTPAAATAGTCSAGTTYSGAFTSPSSTFILKYLGTKAGFVNSMVVTSNYTISSGGPQWTGILSPQRAMDWSMNGATVVKYTTQCGSTIAAYSGTAAAINSAIAACPPNTYVLLGTGTFTLSSSVIINAHNFVSWRGMGAPLTHVTFTAVSTNCNGVGGTAVCVINGDDNSFQNPIYGNLANWTAGFAQNSTSLTLSSTTNLAVGKLIVLSQNDDTTDTGGIFFCQTAGVNGDCSQQGGGGVAKPNASETQMVRVVSITGGVVNIAPQIYAPNWTSAKSPTAYYSNNQPIVGVGIENMTLDYSNLGEEENGIEFMWAYDCWVRGIRSINNTASGGATHKHVNIYDSQYVTVRDSYFYGASPTSEGYGVDNGPASSNDKTENNIFQHLPTGTINETSCCNAIDQNYAVDDYYTGGGSSPNWQQQNGFSHGAGDYFDLWEGNQGIGWDGDVIHGTHFAHTLFREYDNGRDPVTVAPSAPSGPKNQATIAVFPFAGNRFMNVVGGVFGTASYHTFYQNVETSIGDCNGTSGNSSLSVFAIGFSDQAGTGYNPTCVGAAFQVNNDSVVATSLLRWGNFAACTGDPACNSIRFVTSEDASSGPSPAGLASPNATLPKSFIYTAAPPFWGSMQFPAVGPGVTGGTIPGTAGMVINNPAAACYLGPMAGAVDGSSGVLSFDPDSPSFCNYHDF